MMPLAAYTDRLSVRPGESISIHAANATGQPVTARIVRVISADPNPGGPGIQTQAVEAQLECVSQPAPERVPIGSFGQVDSVGRCFDGQFFTLFCRIFPTVHSGTEQALLSRIDGQNGFSLYLDQHGGLQAKIGTSNGFEGTPTLKPLPLRRWHAVWLICDVANGLLRIGHAPLGDPMSANQGACWAESTPTTIGVTAPSVPLLIAAQGPSEATAHFTGKLEAPVVFDRALVENEIDQLLARNPPAGAVAGWDFAIDVSSSRIVDTGPHAMHGRLRNSPARGMTGSNWTGKEMSYRHAPHEYGAIHFHRDDIDDCEWPVCFVWTVPPNARSAVYAWVLEAGDAVENVPFHIVPPRGARQAGIAVLASTFTYTIYGNHLRADWAASEQWRQQWRDQSASWGGYPAYPGEHREYGLSTYNAHLDGSGISIASWHRPMLTMRVGYVTYPGEPERASGLRHFPADTHLISWLEAKGYDYDVITDWELHHEGVDVLQGYPVVLTGSHPEYHTSNTLDALVNYRDQGGRLGYLGGNGFYWKVALSPEKDGVIEIRRGEGGIRAWAAEPGEYYNQFDGEYGGLWRRNGRPPQNLCGVGFTAQGHFSGSYYRKRAEARDARVAWMFEGMAEDIIGDHGFSGHGAAGFELDRADHLLGTPVHALVVASSENHPPETPWVVVPEELLTHLTTWSGESPQDLIRADMTFFEAPLGGAVFSTGSITFCGSLVTNGFDNDVSTLLDNVVRRFLDPTPFEMPSE